jgi:hypothetical protein
MAALSVGGRGFFAFPSLGKQRAGKKRQATPNSEFPPELISDDRFQIQGVSDGVARFFRFVNQVVMIALTGSNLGPFCRSVR